MTLPEQIRNIFFYYIKTRYNDYIFKNNIKFIPENDIYNVISSLYNEEKKPLQEFIRNCLKEMLTDNYPETIVENIIFEIFEDQELAINRVSLEIKKYQDCIINNVSEEYEIKLAIDKDYGIGLKMDFFENEIIVKNYKRNKDKILGAEDSGKISIGDTLVEINHKSLDNIEMEEKINIVTKAMQNDFVYLKFRSYTNKITDLLESV